MKRAALILPATADSVGRGILFAIAAAAGFVAMDSLAKYLGPVIPVDQLVWGRYTFHLLILIALIPILGPTPIVRTREPGFQLLRGAILLGGTTSTYIAVQYLPLTMVYSIAFTAPLLVTILSIPLLGERVGPRRWMAVAVGFLGALVVVRPGSGELNIGVLFACGMALAFALYQILTRRSASVDGPLVGLFYAALLGAVLLTLAAPFGWIEIGATGWGFLVLLGVLGALSHFVFIMALHSAPASVVSPFSYTQIVWAVLIGFFVFGDIPDVWTLIGTSLVVGAGLYVFLRERRLGREPPPLTRD